MYAYDTNTYQSASHNDSSITLDHKLKTLYSL